REMRLTDIEIRNDQLGKPTIILHNRAKEVAKELGIKEVLISLSHTEEYAVAQAVALSKKD
ncbi:MAG: holo-(acyl-carrier-protein) synthase, partial [Candidatus Frackibacter sp. T328-2]